MNPFHAHGIRHLSASQLTTFCADPSKWYAQKVLGHRSPSSAAMERGKAVETGIVHALKGETVARAVELALNDYDVACRFNLAAGDVDGERGNIAPMVEVGLGALRGYGEPDWPEQGQHRVEIDVAFGDGEDDHIPIMGFCDLLYPDLVVDLKSTTRVPAEMSFAHRIQGAVYARTTNRPVKFVYVSAKKAAALEDPDVADSQSAVRAIVKRMAAFLALSPDPEILRHAVPVVVDSWSWRGEEAARRRLYGI